MKKITIFFLITVLILVLPVIATSEENDNITSNIELTQENQEIIATILINNLNSKGTKALTGKIKFDSNALEYIESEFIAPWNGAVSTDGTSFTVYTSQDENINKIVRLKFKIKSDANLDETKISIDNILLALEEGNGEPENEIKVEGDLKTIQIEKQKNNMISMLIIVTITLLSITIIYIINKKERK